MIEQTLTSNLKKYIITLTEQQTLEMQQTLLDELNNGTLGDEHNAEFDFLTHCIGIHRKLSTITVKDHNSYCGRTSPELKFYTNNGVERQSGYVACDGSNGYYFGATKKKAIENALYSKTITYRY